MLVISRLESVLLCGGGQTLRLLCILTALHISPSPRYILALGSFFNLVLLGSEIGNE
jgi:hypothetical protein